VHPTLAIAKTNLAKASAPPQLLPIIPKVTLADTSFSAPSAPYFRYGLAPATPQLQPQLLLKLTHKIPNLSNSPIHQKYGTVQHGTLPHNPHPTQCYAPPPHSLAGPYEPQPPRLHHKYHLNKTHHQQHNPLHNNKTLSQFNNPQSIPLVQQQTILLLSSHKNSTGDNNKLATTTAHNQPHHLLNQMTLTMTQKNHPKAKQKPKNNLTLEQFANTKYGQLHCTKTRLKQPTINPTNRTYNTILLQHITSNKQPTNSIERKLHKIRQHYQQHLNITHTPHPTKTHCVIYVGYSANPKYKQLYVGKTKNKAFVRRNQEINTATSKPYLLLSKFINKIGPDNYRVLPLQTVKQWSLSHHFERYWINRLRTHFSKLFNNNGLNYSHEHLPLKHRTPNKSKHQIKNSNNHPQSHNHSPRNHHSRNFLSRIVLLYSLTTPQQQLQQLQHYNLFSLYRILSILQNRVANPHPHNTTSKFALSLPHQHTALTTCLPSTFIKSLTSLIIKAIITKTHQPRSPNKQKSSIYNSIYIAKYTHPLLNKLALPQILKQSIQQLPRPYNRLILPQIIYKNSPPSKRHLFNAKETIQHIQLTKDYNLKLPPCNCHQPQYQPYLNHHGHICTADTSLLLHTPNHLAPLLIQIMSYGNKYIETPNLSHSQLLKHITQSLNIFITNAAKKHHINKSHLQPILSTTLNIIKQKLSTIPKSNTSYTTTLTRHDMKTYIQQLHSFLVINAPDKLPNNYNFTCKLHYCQTAHNSLFPIKLNLNNPNTNIQPPLPQQLPPTPTKNYATQLSNTLTPPPYFHIPTWNHPSPSLTSVKKQQ
jgi:hypothetical protein